MRALALIAGLASIAVLGAGNAQAQSLDTSYAAAFEARVAAPNDTTILGTFIDVAVREGQYDQALSTVEQHLIAHPRDAKARLIAGRLYNHLSSYELARRQVQHALDIGTLSDAETREAEDLLRRIEKAIAGWSGSLTLTAGVRSEWIEFDNGADRDDVAPFARAVAILRQDLKTATRDAIIYSGYVEASHRYFDVDLTSTSGDQDYLRGRAAVTWDKGLPNFGIETLRMLLSGYYQGETFESDEEETETGISLRFTARPTVDSFVFAGVSYGWVDGDATVLTEERFSWEAGLSHRLTGSWSAGLAIKGSEDYRGSTTIGDAWFAEASVGGVVYTIPQRLIWTHQLGLGVGERTSPDQGIFAPPQINTDYWQISSEHDFQIGEKQFVSFDLTYTETEYDNPLALDRETITAILSYSYILE
ncbi:tetratricopeptide repeat protein [Tepidamorphus sp. 3E244]|uniref:tetratricopeptide repeat protein n=1 Tax=Tepidamorphus sp. 3E244 TaxID=3385498 RepID=UPI0038FBF1C9